MKRTYTHTWLHDNLADAEVVLYISKVNRYNRGSRIYDAGADPEDEEKVILPPIKSWTVVEGGAEAKAVESIMDEVDDNHEYLIINLVGGNTEIYRNSYVTMFIH